MSLLKQIRARRTKGPGSVEIDLGDGDKLVVELKYPKAAAQAEFVAFLNTITDKMSTAESIEKNEQLTALAIRLCAANLDDEVEDEDMSVLVRETGGYNGPLAQRCLQLLGLSGDSADVKVVKGKPKRGR